MKLELLDIAIDKLRKAMSAEDIVKLGHELVQEAIALEKKEKLYSEAKANERKQNDFERLRIILKEVEPTPEHLERLLTAFTSRFDW